LDGHLRVDFEMKLDMILKTRLPKSWKGQVVGRDKIALSGCNPQEAFFALAKTADDRQNLPVTDSD
jgi:hypothetical protein